MEQSQRVTGFDHQRLVLRQKFQVLLDQPILQPVLTNTAGFAIGN
jgi:hypothetical protein